MKVNKVKRAIIAAFAAVFAFVAPTFAANVAKVGNTEYATIDEAIANWTNGSTLTLLSNVTLSKTIELSSTEYHVLDLGTYTMTAASSKDAIQIVNNGRSSASYALDIKADATNPGGITATGKAVVRTTGKSGVKDRPIIRFYNGVFTGTNVVYHSGSNGTNCPQFWFYGGTFNGTVYANRAKFIFYGGTFNGSLQMSVDSSADALVVGGKFKQLSNLYGSSLNTDKFTIGSAAGVYDREVYVDENGYYVVAVAEPAEGIEAAVEKKPSTNDYFAYSKVATEGALNYTDAVVALKNNNTTSAKVTIYADEIDLEGINFKGTIVVPEGNDITISNAPSTLKVQLADGTVTVLTPVDGMVATSIRVKTLDELVAALNSDSSLPIVITETVVIPADQEVTLDLKGKTVTGKVHKSVGAVIKNEGTLTLTNGTITSAAANGGSALVNSGTATVTGVTLNGAPNADGSWPSYTVNNTGVLNLNDSKLTSYHGALASYNDGAIATLTNTDIDMSGIPGFTSHAIYTYNNGSVIVNSGNIANNAADQNSTGASVINGAVTVNGGTFNGRVDAYNGTPVICGGTFTYNGAIVDVSRYVPAGYAYDATTGAVTIKINTWGGIDWTLTADGVLTIKPTTGTPGKDNSGKWQYEVGQWPEAVRYNSKGEGVAVEGWPYDRSKVKKLVIEEGVTKIGSFTAQGFTSLTGEVVIPSTVTYIGQEAFQKSTFTKLTFAAVPNGQNGAELCIAQGALKNLVIEEIAFPADRPVHLHAWMFANCNNLKHVTFPATLKGIGSTTHVDYQHNPNATNGGGSNSCGLLSKCPALETITFGSQAVRDLYYNPYYERTDAPMVVNVGLKSYRDFKAGIEAAQTGDTILMLGNVTIDEDITLPAGVTFNGNNKSIEGATVWADGNLTFVGHTKVTNFNAGYNNPTITIRAGASLELTGSSRMVIGHGATFNITGKIADAKTADKATLEPSLIMPGASFTGAGVTFNVKNAYIIAPSSYCSSSKSASGTFDFNIENSIIETAGKLAFESQSTAATVNFELKNSVLNTGSHLVFGVAAGEVVIDNSNVNVGTSRQLENRSTMTIKNGSVVNGAVATSSNAINPGTIIVENATYAVTGQFSGAAEGTGTLIIKKGATVSVGSIVDKANIQIDATDMTADDEINLTANLSKFAGTVEVINNDKLEAKIVDGKIVLSAKPVAQIGEQTYTTLAAALAAAQAGETITLLMDAEISGQNAMDKLTAKTLDLNDKTLTVAGNSYFKDGTTTFKNGNIVVSGYASDSFFCGYTTGAKIVFDDVTVTGTDYSTGCAVFNANQGTIEVKNSTVNLYGDASGGIFYGGQILVEKSTVSANDVCRGFTVSTVTIKDSTVALSGTAGNSKFETGLNSSTVTINNSTVAISNASKRAVRLDNNTLTLENSSTLTATGCAKDIVPSSENSDAVVIKSEDSTINATNEIPPPVAMIGTKGYKTLQAAINAVKNGETITLVADCAETVTFTQTKDLSFVIDGNSKTMTGSINITARAGKDALSTLLIKNFVFQTDKTSHDFINSVETNYYPNNITIQNCSFTGTADINSEGYAVVAVRLKSANNILIKDCTGSGLHSFLQNTAGWNVNLENVDVTNSLGGFAMGTVQGTAIKHCDLDVATMGIRLDAALNNNAQIEDCTVKAFIPVVVRKASVESKITFNGNNTMTPSNTDGLWFAAGTSEYEENGKMPTAPTGKVVVTLNGTGLNAAGVYGNYGVALVNGVKYVTLKDAVAAVADGGIITLIGNVTITEATRTHNSGSWYDGIYYVGDKSFTIDLGGFTVTHDGAVNDYLLNFKNDGAKENTITLKNGTIDAGTAAFCAICTSSASTQMITINTENINIVNNISNGSTVKIRGGAEFNANAGTKITGKNSYLGIECVASTVNIYDGAEIYMNGTGSYNGCLVGACGGGVVNVYGGYGKGVKGGFIAMTSGGTINVFGGEWIANMDGSVGDNSNFYVLTAQNNKYESGWAGASVINVTGGTFRGGMDAWVLNNIEGEKSELNIAGGNFNANPTAYLDEGYVVNEVNGVYTVAKAVAKIGADYYTNLVDAFKAATSGCTIEILEDIVFEGNWDDRQIATGMWSKFTVPVTVEGNGNTIKVIGSLSDPNGPFLFKFEADAIVSDLVVDISDVTNAKATAISSKADLTISNCKFIGNGQSSRGIRFGEGAGTNIGEVDVVITDSEFINFGRGISDNENGQNAKTVVITDNKITNASVNVSASESLVFQRNAVSGANSAVIITSYNDEIDSVIISDNTLADGATGRIQNAKNYDNVQSDFTVKAPVSVLKADGAVKYYNTVQAAVNAAQNGDTVVISAGEYAPINISNKNITIQGTVGDNGELLTVIKGGNPAITAHGFNGTIKDIKIVDAFKVMYAEPAGNVTVDNICVTGATYGLHLVAYSTGLTWNIQNSYMDLAWANSFGVYGTGDAAIVIKGNEFASTNPYYPDYGAIPVNTFMPNITVEENIFGENTKIKLAADFADKSNISISKNYHADGVENAFADDSSAKVFIDSCYTGIDANGTLTGLVSCVAKIGDASYASLQSALNAAVAGKGNVTVDILADINMTGKAWTPVAVDSDSFVTVNGNNKIITGLSDMLFAKTWAGTSGLVINDLTISASQIVHNPEDAGSEEGVGAFVGFPEASKTVTLNNCHLVNSTVNGGHWTGGLVGYAAGYAGTDGPVFMTLTITNCSVTGSTITGKGSAGGIIGHGSGNAWTDVIIVDSTVSGNTITSTGTSDNKAGSVMGTIGAAGQPTTVNGVIKTGGMSVSVTTTGNTVKSADTVITTIYGRQGTATGLLEIAGGSYEANPVEEGVAYASPIDGYKIAQNTDGTYGLKSALEGEGTEASPYIIATVEDLVYFRDYVNSGKTKFNAPGVWIALGADIDMAGINWVGIGSITQDHGFMGNFNGNGFKIQNLTISSPTLDSDGYAYAGFFSVTEGTDANNQNIIKNLTIENVTIDTTGHIVSAAIAYPYYTIVDNVKVCGDINITGGNYTAGALAYTRRCVNASNVSVVGNDGSTITGAQTVGGVISDIQMNGGLTAVYSNFSAENLTITGTKQVGGIAGIIATQTLNGATVKNVTIVCSDTNRVGQVAGAFGGTSTISNIVVEKVTGATAVIGGAYDGGAAVQAKVGDTFYATFAEAFAAAKSGDTLSLLADIEASEVILLDKNLTINGNGHKVTSSATRVFRVTTADTEVTLNDVNMVSTAVRVGTNDIRGISVDDVKNVKLTLNNCSVDFTDASANDWAYAVNVTGGSNHTLTVNGGTYEGANVINVRGANNTVAVKNATLNSLYPNNDKYYGAGIWVEQEKGSSVEATGNTFNGTNALAFNLGTGTSLTASNNTDNTSVGAAFAVAKIGDKGYMTLASAIAVVKNGETIVLAKDCNENVTISQKVGVSFAIDGDNKTYTGTINIHGNSRFSDETLTIMNFAFFTTEAEHDFIWSDSQDAPARYPHNVTVSNSEFMAIGNGKDSAVGIRLRQGKNINVVDCSATGLHSLIQAKSCSGAGVNVDGVRMMNCKNGMSFGTSNFSVVNSLISTTGADSYGIRADGSGAYMATVEDCVIDAYIPVLVRNTADDGFTLTVAGDNHFMADNGLMENDESYLVVFSKGDVDAEKSPVAPETTFNLVIEDGSLDPSKVYPGFEALVGTKYFGQLEDAVAAAQDGDTVTVLKNVGTDAAIQVAKKVTIDLNGKTIAATENDKVGDGVFCVVAGGDLTINDSVGTGVINGVGDNDYNIAIWANGGKVTINGGNYTNVGATDKTDPNAHFDLIYAKNGGEVVINGGHFECQTPAFTLNSHDTNKGTITVNGGTFVGFDPRNNAAETAGTTFMAPGKFTMSNGNNYVVVEPGSYMLNEAYCAKGTVADIDAAIAGAVTLTTIDGVITAKATFTFKVTAVDTINPEKSSYELTGGKLRPGKTVAVKYIDLATGTESWDKPEADTVTFKLVIK